MLGYVWNLECKIEQIAKEDTQFLESFICDRLLRLRLAKGLLQRSRATWEALFQVVEGCGAKFLTAAWRFLKTIVHLLWVVCLSCCNGGSWCARAPRSCTETCKIFPRAYQCPYFENPPMRKGDEVRLHRWIPPMPEPQLLMPLLGG